MQYFISFLEGIITFISPCLLPMLPIYISYFANGENDRKKTIINVIGFVLGFSIVFVGLGAFAGSIGGVLNENKTIINIITGIVVVILGLNFTGLIRIKFLSTTIKPKINIRISGFFASLIFGIIFSIGWTPCVGAFLGSALMMASQSGEMLKGVIMLVAYSFGLAIPFIISAILIDQLKSVFSVIKRNYKVINVFSGVFLIIIGVLMMTGMMGYFMSLLQF